MTSDLVRTWKGESPQERVDSRRKRLIDAAIDLLGGVEGGQLTMRAACREAGLSQRYFYETFTDRDELAGAAYQACYAAMLAGIAEDAGGFGTVEDRLHASFRAVVTVIERDPRIGRIMFREAQTDDAVRVHAERALREFFGGLVGSLPESDVAEPRRREWTTTYLIGALFRLFDEWIASGMPDGDAFVDFCNSSSIATLRAGGLLR
ncbi:TetR/AcrR family transcriptional regulator [Smaragdicoccus niigatensis]|uniref:TetR/AcrR family transcriptional regulator n=1 Tax=Smaragdicoccus niigatensis TaxID=359359 RepID=UPI00036A3AE3|nr:TetR/AcrR family transcriptional regulator [Smaragdicoccus niigatensis]